MSANDLELYIHIPFCVKKCDYCDFLSFPADNRTQEEYTRALIREIEWYGKSLRLAGREDRVVSVFFGGGTPSWLDAPLISDIMEALRRNFPLTQDCEISIECNPGTVTAQKLATYRQIGINRLSIGCQSADDAELKLLGRIHTFDQFLKTYELARGAGFTNINVDLISCLPYQNAAKFLKSLQAVWRLKPEHISVYTLIIEKGTPFYDRYKFDDVKQHAGMETEALPNEDEAYTIYKRTQAFLKEAGYHQYEISNYARPGFECRHNIGYWQRTNYLGFGIGAASLYENIRYTNTSDLWKYIEGTALILQEADAVALSNNLHAGTQVLSRKEQMEEFMFLGLRMPEGVYRSDFEKTFGLPVDAVYRDVIEELKKEELLISREGRLYLTDKGLDLSNYAMAKFLLDS